jgi:large conductance mechanosensitive channel
MLKEFKTFILRGNVIDLAVGVIIGGAFGKIVSSLVNDILMPLVGLILGRVDFKGLFIALDGKSYVDLAAAQAAKAPTVNYGLFIQNVVDFLIIALVIFWLIKTINRLTKPAPAPAAPAEPTTKSCPFCATEIPIKAQRCPHCTSNL